MIITRFSRDHPQLLVVSLGERGDRRVVVDEHGNPEALAEHLANGTSASGTLTEEITRPVSNSTTEGTPTPTPLQPFPARRLDHLHELLDQGIGTGALGGLDH